MLSVLHISILSEPQDRKAFMADPEIAHASTVGSSRKIGIALQD
jgi:hypothetical protein